jgi:hypothetical protein
MLRTSTKASGGAHRHINGSLLLYGLVLAAATIATAAPAFAQSSGNACIVEEVGGNPSCTANDVRIGKMELVTGPSSCDPDDPTPFAVTIKATIESGPDRYDIGLWFNTAGNSAHSDPSGDNCYRDFLHPVDGQTTCQQQGGPYYNADADDCGDVYAQKNPCGRGTAPCTEGGGTVSSARSNSVWSRAAIPTPTMSSTVYARAGTTYGRHRANEPIPIRHRLEVQLRHDQHHRVDRPADDDHDDELHDHQLHDEQLDDQQLHDHELDHHELHDHELDHHQLDHHELDHDDVPVPAGPRDRLRQHAGRRL